MLQVYDVGAAKKDAKSLVALIKQTVAFGEKELGVTWIGWCTDAGGDARKARRLLYEEMPWMICPDCYAHQVRWHSEIILHLSHIRLARSI